VPLVILSFQSTRVSLHFTLSFVVKTDRCIPSTTTNFVIPVNKRYMFRSVLVETCSVVTGIITFVVDNDVRLSVINMYNNGMNSV